MTDNMPGTLPPALAEALGFYVYRLLDPVTDGTFYVGKGSGNRVLQHARDALASANASDKLDRIRAIHAAGLEVRVVIHRHAMPEVVALEVEAALIDAYQDLTNLVSGQGALFGPAPLEELATRYAAPEAVIRVPAIIIKIEQEWLPSLTPEMLYERTRRYWKCSPERRRPRPSHALAVARGIIREVYRIEGWETYTTWPDDSDPSRLIAAEPWPENYMRRGFFGQREPELASLIGCSVRHLTTTGSQNPIAYVNC